MTEIGLAQKRLLDDEVEAPYSDGGQQSPPTPIIHEEPPQSASLFTDDEPGNLQGIVQQDDRNLQPSMDQQIEVTEYGAMHRDADFDGDVNEHHYDESTHIIPNYDPGESSTSYNYFESSLKGSADPLSVEYTASITRTNENGLQKTPIRSKSMQTTSYSPHDTEPMSSLISPRLSRARSDNASGSNQQQQQQQLSQRSVYDELSAPVHVAIEIPIVKKTRGRKKRPVVLDDDDDEEDELALPEPNGVIEHNNDQEEQRNPESVIDTEIQNVTAPENEMNQEIKIDIPQERPARSPKRSPPAKQEVNFVEPTKAKSRTAREPRKKKLKRGKTTSVALKKTYESDIEDDVIWIDERPLHPPLQNEGHPDGDPLLRNKRSGQGNTKSDTPNLFGKVEENPNSESGTPSTTLQTTEPAPPPEPKKRGRKRKKTSEQVEYATETADQTIPPVQYGQEDNRHLRLRFEETETPSNGALEDISSNVNGINHDNDYNNNHDTNQEDMDRYTTNSKTPTPEKHEPIPPNPSIPQNQLDTKPTVTQTPDNTETPKRQHQQHHHHLNHPDTEKETALETEKNMAPGKDPRKGPDKHSPISATSKVPFRVGLSRRARIAPLLKIVRR